MTALISRIDFHNFGKYYGYAMKRLRACLVIQVIAALLSYPMAALATNVLFDFAARWGKVHTAYYNALPNPGPELEAEWQAMQQQEDTALMVLMVLTVIAVAALVTLLFMHFFVPLVSYRRLYRKTYADMDFSLPVSADGMFWGDLMAGATVTILPHLVGIVVGIIAMQPLYGVDMESVEVLFSILDNDVIPLAFTLFLAAIMLYAMTVLVIGCCGKRFHAAAMPILVNIAVPVAHYLLCYLGKEYAAGNWSSATYMINQSMFVTSPIGMGLSSLWVLAAISEGFTTSGEYFSPVNYYPIQQPQYLIPALIVIVLIILGAWLIIRRRRAEQTGAGAFAVKPAQYAIHGLTTLAVAAVAAWNISRSFDLIWGFSSDEVTLHIYDIINVYSVLLLMAMPVVYLVLELAAGERKRFGWSLARCGATTIAAAGITLAVMNCNAFGAYMRAPGTGDVGAVSIYINHTGTDTYFRYYFKEKENIEMVARLHNSIESEYDYGSIFKMAERLDDGSLIGVTRLELEYYHYNGMRSDRAVEISDETLIKILHEIAQPEAMTNSCYEFQRNAGEITGMLSLDNGDSEYTPLTKGGLTAEMLYEAVKKDCGNVTYERMFGCEAGNYSRDIYFSTEPEWEMINQPMLYTYNAVYAFDPNESGRVTVYPWFDNTLALLREYGAEVDFGFDTDRYNTAFLVKSIPTGEKSGAAYYQCYSGIKVSLPDLFGLAGEVSYIDYYRFRRGDDDGNVYTYNEAGERVLLKEEEIVDNIRQEYKYLQAAEIGIDKAAELYPMCGSVYNAETDYNSDYYMLVLVNAEDGDVMSDGYKIADYTWLFIPAEHFDKAAEMFNAAYVE